MIQRPKSLRFTCAVIVRKFNPTGRQYFQHLQDIPMLLSATTASLSLLAWQSLAIQIRTQRVRGIIQVSGIRGMQRAIQIGRITGTAGPLRRSPALILISLRGTSRSAPQIEQESRSSGWSYWASIRMPINELDQKVAGCPPVSASH